MATSQLKCTARWLQLGCLLLTLFFAGSARPMTDAQTASDSTQSVMLDVIALNKQGEPVEDLKAEEFHLEVNHHPQSILSASILSSANVAFCLVFDVSGSEREDRGRGVEISEAKKFLHQTWRQGDVSFVVAFNDVPFVFSKPSRDLADAEKGLDTVLNFAPRASTALYDCLCGIQTDRTTRLRTLILVFSDFDDDASRATNEKALQCPQREGFRVFPVLTATEFIGQNAKSNMHRAVRTAHEFADQSGGEVLAPASMKDLPKMLASLGGHLRSGYEVWYSLPANEKPNKPDRIVLTTSRKDVDLRYAKAQFRH
jgi:VWFA-related protein